MYYLANIENTGFDNYETVFETREPGRTNTFEWLDIDSLDRVLLYPEFIKNEIKNPDKSLRLIITRE